MAEFDGNRFLAITSVLSKIKKRFQHHRASLIKTRRMTYSLTSKGQFENLTSGQGHDLAQIGHIIYHSIRFDKINTMAAVWNLYLNPIKSYYIKTTCDLR